VSPAFSSTTASGGISPPRHLRLLMFTSTISSPWAHATPLAFLTDAAPARPQAPCLRLGWNLALPQKPNRSKPKRGLCQTGAIHLLTTVPNRGHPSVGNDHKSFPQIPLRRLIRALTQRKMQNLQAPDPIRVSLCSSVVEKIAIPRHDGRITDVKTAQTPIRCGESISMPGLKSVRLHISSRCDSETSFCRVTSDWHPRLSQTVALRLSGSVIALPKPGPSISW
jgi:hypothetical protein